MNTYFVLDPDTNTWSPKHQPLKEIMTTPGVTGNHLLANAQTQETLTVAQALASTRKPALKAPAIPLLKRPSSASAAPRPSTARPHKSAVTQPLRRKKAPRSEYKVLGQRDECFGGRFDATSLELVLNSYARQGWKVLSCVQSPANPLAEPKLSDLLIVMERKVAAGGAASA